MSHPFESVLFEKLVRKRELPHPTSRTFDIRKWIEAAADQDHLEERDRDLLSAAAYFGQELKSLRLTFEDRLFKGLDRRSALLLSVAMANHNFVILSKKFSDQVGNRFKGKVADLDILGGERISSPFPGNSSTVDTIVATIVDALPHCLERAAKRERVSALPSIDYWQIGSSSTASLSIEYNLKDLWQRVVWDGWKLETKDRKLRLSPVDRRIAELWEAWIWRQHMIHGQGTILDGVAERIIRESGRDIRAFISPTVVGIGGGSKGGRKFRFGEVSGKLQSQTWHRAEATILDESYLGQFLDAHLGGFSFQTSCRNLHRAWCIIRDCAHVLEAKAKKVSLDDLYGVEAWGFFIRRSELVRAIVGCTESSEDQAEEIVGFFECDLSKLGELFVRGVWAAPLLGVDGSQEIAIVGPAVFAGSPIRRVEDWLRRGGLSDNLANARRGVKYEAWVRSQLSDSIKKNKVLPNAICPKEALPRADGASEQIDFLAVIGDKLIVGEVKCYLYPVEPIERFDHLRKLSDASIQVCRKAKWVSTHADLVTSFLSIDATRFASLEIIPVVILNQGAGFGLELNGAVVADFHFLKSYFSSSKLVDRSRVDFQEGGMTQSVLSLYKHERDAGDRLRSTILGYSPLKRYLDAGKWTYNSFPRSDGGELMVENFLRATGFNSSEEVGGAAS